MLVFSCGKHTRLCRFPPVNSGGMLDNDSTDIHQGVRVRSTVAPIPTSKQLRYAQQCQDGHPPWTPNLQMVSRSCLHLGTRTHPSLVASVPGLPRSVRIIKTRTERGRPGTEATSLAAVSPDPHIDQVRPVKTGQNRL